MQSFFFLGVLRVGVGVEVEVEFLLLTSVVGEVVLGSESLLPLPAVGDEGAVFLLGVAGLDVAAADHVGRGLKRGVASLCLGGGEAVALAIEI